MLKRTIFTILIMLFSVMLVSADGVDDQGNPNDPDVNDRANACFEGGSMEGKCDTEWEWACGWHLIQFEYDLTTRDEFPAWCISIIPPEIVPASVVSRCTHGDNYINYILIGDHLTFFSDSLCTGIGTNLGTGWTFGLGFTYIDIAATCNPLGSRSRYVVNGRMYMCV